MEFDWSKLDKEFALKVKNFLNQQFQKISLPSFLKNINIVSLDFGTVSPVVDIENIEDPYSHFYEDSDLSHDELDEELIEPSKNSKQDEKETDTLTDDFEVSSTSSQPPPYVETGFSQFHMHNEFTDLLTQHISIASHKTVKTNITSNNCLPFFQSTFSGSLGNIVSASGLSTPRWVGSHLLNTYHHILPRNEESLNIFGQSIHTMPSSNTSPTLSHTKTSFIEDKNRESKCRNLNDFQIRLRITYEGNMKMEITAELHLNYHSSLFISLPVKITLTGLSFEAIAILAYVNKRFHFCFIDDEQKEKLLKNIKIESEIGDKNKQILKNVGKIEIFLLEQLRKIIERELVFPSWLTIII
ncbi:hypothetical protein PORY_001018 [Pneumocystis oryctolagi]|uniref:Uncharacterized protein n=1 Tax=Pneumocystis oryctolagi TaxID=42067 RepID=A0ACB7CCI7_9ASCO|nr:hypothetical protein PORY_001018 [Pneumocystis oryctolagi]